MALFLCAGQSVIFAPIPTYKDTQFSPPNVTSTHPLLTSCHHYRTSTNSPPPNYIGIGTNSQELQHCPLIAPTFLFHSSRAVPQAIMQAPQDLMSTDEMMEEQTQQATQSTQYSGSQGPGDASSHLWGFLQPCSTLLKRIDFFKVQPTVSIGRNGEQNEIILPGGRVSACTSPSLFLLRVVAHS